MFPCNIFYILLFFFFSAQFLSSLWFISGNRISNHELYYELQVLRSRITEKQIFHFFFYVFSFKFQKKIKIKGVQAKSVCSQFSTGSPKKRAVFEYSSTDREARCNLRKMSLNEPLNMAPNYKLFCTSSGSINAEKRLLSKVGLTLNQSL